MAAVVENVQVASMSGPGGGSGTSDNSRGRGRGRGHSHSHGNGRGGGRWNGNNRGRGGAGRGRGRGSSSQASQKQEGVSSTTGGGSDGPTVTAPAAVSNARRARFNAALTTNANADKNTASDARSEASVSTATSAAQATVASTSRARVVPPPKDSSLLAQLSHALTHAPHPECPICFVAVRPRDAIHSCLVCYKPFHLKCIKDWSNRSVSESRNVVVGMNPREGEGKWRCPACNSQFGEKEMPGEYGCFCGKMNLGIKAQQEGEGGRMLRRGKVAHSCNQPCGKTIRNSRGEKACDHPCAHFCHPGPCPPCGIVITPSCHCGSKTLNLRCSSLSSSGPSTSATPIDPLSCNSVCNKVLECGIHHCSSICHSGPCPPCEVVRSKRCYCGESVMSSPCAEIKGERKPCHSPIEGTSGWEGEFSCERSCPWMYDCGLHQCEEAGGRCHAHERRETLICPRSPAVVVTCPCDNSVPLEKLGGNKREKCTDALITCGRECGRRLECGHACRRKCHDGECLGEGEECTEQLAIVCRCGDLKLSRTCAEARRILTKRTSFAVSDEGNLLCEKVCKSLKSCGRHPCNRKCCPLSFQEHERARKKGKWRAIASARDEALEDPQGWHKCDLICGKKLACGRHFCEDTDHKGPCGRCLNARFEELVCNCGKTILPPPIPCGTSISCSFPCTRPPPPCGHDKVPHTCHEDDNPCPPCPYLTTKTCQCWRQTQMKNVRCAAERVSCGLACGRFLDCGFHRCTKSCHTGDCGACSQVCGKPRKFCGHPCDTQCHAPFPCPAINPCKSTITVSCACGHISQKVVCNSSEEHPEGNRSRVLKCKDACAVEKRNKAFCLCTWHRYLKASCPFSRSGIRRRDHVFLRVQPVFL
ncbi:hypothetical protein BT69DRAFT_642465 [Atractiella rhizophila]|nr:hypothetical protein BT69DRAFT_642465 [Atractiella rhizophila]